MSLSFLRRQIFLTLLTMLYWAASREKVPSNIRKTSIFRSSCTCANYHQDLRSPVIHSVVQMHPIILLMDSEGSDQILGSTDWSDIRCPPMPEDTLSHSLALCSNNRVSYVHAITVQRIYKYFVGLNKYGWGDFKQVSKT